MNFAILNIIRFFLNHSKLVLYLIRKNGKLSNNIGRCACVCARAHYRKDKKRLRMKMNKKGKKLDIRKEKGNKLLRSSHSRSE